MFCKKKLHMEPFLKKKDDGTKKEHNGLMRTTAAEPPIKHMTQASVYLPFINMQASRMRIF